MRWRWLVPTLVALVLIDAFSGMLAYSSGTWNLAHTEVLTRWDAVREVCLVMFPIFAGSLLLIGSLVALAVHWAIGGRR